jgi:hypothetical protein
MPRLQEVLPHGLNSPLDELIFWLNDAATMYNGAHPQDAINFKRSPALSRIRKLIFALDALRVSQSRDCALVALVAPEHPKC